MQQRWLNLRPLNSRPLGKRFSRSVLQAASVEFSKGKSGYWSGGKRMCPYVGYCAWMLARWAYGLILVRWWFCLLQFFRLTIRQVNRQQKCVKRGGERHVQKRTRN